VLATWPASAITRRTSGRRASGFIPPFALTGRSRVIAACVVGDLLVLGVTRVTLPPRSSPFPVSSSWRSDL
jgi:hypothetical protein